eukprot:12419363-Prorocentrum_lima.AAC.1
MRPTILEEEPPTAGNDATWVWMEDTQPYANYEYKNTGDAGALAKGAIDAPEPMDDDAWMSMPQPLE